MVIQLIKIRLNVAIQIRLPIKSINLQLIDIINIIINVLDINRIILITFIV